MMDRSDGMVLRCKLNLLFLRIPCESLRIVVALSEWVSDAEPCELRVRGYFFVRGEPQFNTAFAEVWE